LYELCSSSTSSGRYTSALAIATSERFSMSYGMYQGQHCQMSINILVPTTLWLGYAGAGNYAYGNPTNTRPPVPFSSYGAQGVFNKFTPPYQLYDHHSPTPLTANTRDQHLNPGMGPAGMQLAPPLMQSYLRPYPSSGHTNQSPYHSGRKRGLCVSLSQTESIDLSFIKQTDWYQLPRNNRAGSV
jgi:hypothetical protein